MVCVSYVFFFNSDFPFACFLKRKRQEKELGAWRCGKDLGGVRGGKTVIRIQCTKKITFSFKRYEKQIVK